MHHCQECNRSFPRSYDICPECWERLSASDPALEPRLRLVFASEALYEAELVENLLRDEGIHCLKIPGPGALLWPLGTPSPLAVTRIFVHQKVEAIARSLVAEITGGGSG